MICKPISTGAGIAIGIAIGSAIGVATGQVGTWLAMGIVIGVAIGSNQRCDTVASKDNQQIIPPSSK